MSTSGKSSILTPAGNLTLTNAGQMVQIILSVISGKSLVTRNGAIGKNAESSQ
ncbi:MAG TPA: hypothetical protein VNK26_05490 [Pyrinomonadaceae bacterium]|nr:hypothetical protein [Pyrinomonadaceae bacterium]